MNDATGALDAIRRTELQAARREQAARKKAEEMIDAARVEAERIKDAAGDEGRSLADRRFDAAIAEAEDEAQRVRARGEAEAAALLDVPEQKIDEVVEAMVAVVLAPPVERGK